MDQIAHTKTIDYRKHGKNCEMNIEKLIQEMREQGDAANAALQKKYHKSERVHFGVTTPQCTQFAMHLTKDLEEKEILVLAKAFWETDLFDPMICASKMLIQKKVAPSSVLWKQLLSFLKKVDGWALEDCLCHVAWKCILADERLLDVVEGWTKHPNFWMRRAALVYTLPFAKKGRDPERMLSWAAQYIHDPEWFIQKAIGWWLRVLGEHNPDRVLQFLEEYPLKGVAKKEATRKLAIV